MDFGAQDRGNLKMDYLCRVSHANLPHAAEGFLMALRTIFSDFFPIFISGNE